MFFIYFVYNFEKLFCVNNFSGSQIIWIFFFTNFSKGSTRFSRLYYLFFIKNLIQADVEGELGSILGFTSGVMLKVPVAIFWYYDFKSIGENSTYIYGKKAPIFTIVESIVEEISVTGVMSAIAGILDIQSAYTRELA